MRSLLVVVCCLAVALWTPVSVVAKTCAPICETTDLWGTGSESIGYKECACTYSTTGADRTGPNCGCSGCYIQRSNHIFGLARINGACPAGTTACDDCDIASSSGSVNSTTTAPTTAPTSTTSPTTDRSSTPLTPSSTSPPSGTSGDSTSATGGHVGSPSTNSGSTTTDKSDTSSSLETWQIALIICSAVLVIAVVMITITSCYCKARNRMKDNELIEQDTREYENYWHPGGEDGDLAGGHHLTSSGFGTALAQGGRGSFNSTHSRPNSAKNVSYEPSYTVDERIALGRNNRGSLGSNADLPGIFNAIPQRERPSHEVGSRRNIAIEL